VPVPRFDEVERAGLRAVEDLVVLVLVVLLLDVWAMMWRAPSGSEERMCVLCALP
jgi:hypothetical protein